MPRIICRKCARCGEVEGRHVMAAADGHGHLLLCPGCFERWCLFLAHLPATLYYRQQEVLADLLVTWSLCDRWWRRSRVRARWIAGTL